MSKLICVYDANVLYPAQLRDLLIRLAVHGLVRAHWSDEIHDEWIRNVLADYPDITRADLHRTRQLMDRALPDACVDGHARRIEELTLPDPHDRHVLAAALEVEATAIVTFNLQDFPTHCLQPHGLSAVHPDRFVQFLLEGELDEVIEVMRRHRASLRKPPKSVSEYLRILKRAGLGETVNQLGRQKHQL